MENQKGSRPSKKKSGFGLLFTVYVQQKIAKMSHTFYYGNIAQNITK
jgi:hypothetical protein